MAAESIRLRALSRALMIGGLCVVLYKGMQLVLRFNGIDVHFRL